MKRGWQFLVIVVGLGLCACGPARPEHDKEMQNARGITKVNEAQMAFQAAAKPENKSQARVLEERARAREKQGREWFEKAAAEASHKVAGGDTGATIASYYGVRLNLLQQINPDVDWDGLKTGQVVGRTDARAARAVSGTVTYQNVVGTIYHVLGIDPRHEFTDHAGQPIAISTGDPVHELL